MIKSMLASGFLSLAICGVGNAQQLDAEIVNNAPITDISPVPPTERSKTPDPAIIHLQVLLDRAGSSPGVIDGFYGENVLKAIAGFEVMRGLPVDGKPDPQMISLLQDDKQVIGPYIIAPDDAADLVAAIPRDYAKQAKMRRLGYTSVAERLSERFHMDIDLLRALNPHAQFSPGETIAVAVVGAPRTGKVKRIEARRKSGEVLAFADDGSILAVYPATIGSEDNPSPTGQHKVNGVARNPKYVYNPKINFQQGHNKKPLTLPSGPNNPVGTVWIDLSEPTYGIHGTPEPSLIDKAGSHGCVRLTNWDVEELAGMVKHGVIVDFVE
ncbi:lipoprotein-anchoring transpeptidase ErfK/SrfK [Rhizobium sp. BK650]|uniref:L,D-transpeptidase family protein n=1 Tax=Rhizobium sp. BK650 TaxID=2586990 RepID=UPI0016194DCE|nr:L,D-transpeptidase family protein [Rhizobium sp. BK650]MBB3659189.1 lipoprotein-anchoring transpeptidase ErfK/SrfK [Rhizobium sp. BK650]